MPAIDMLKATDQQHEDVTSSSIYDEKTLFCLLNLNEPCLLCGKGARLLYNYE
jgi:hypothetical protein